MMNQAIDALLASEEFDTVLSGGFVPATVTFAPKSFVAAVPINTSPVNANMVDTPAKLKKAARARAPPSGSSGTAAPVLKGRPRKPRAPSRKEIEETAKKMVEADEHERRLRNGEIDGDEGLFDDLNEPPATATPSTIDEQLAGTIYCPAIDETGGFTEIPMPELSATAVARASNANRKGSAAASAVAAVAPTNNDIDLTPFEFSSDPRALAGHIKPEVAGWSNFQARNKVANNGIWSVQQRAFSLAFAFDRYGEGAIAGPWAAKFLANPAVSDAFVAAWREYCEEAPVAREKDWALEQFAKEQCYDQVYASLSAAFERAGLPALKLNAELPRVTVGPRGKSTKRGSNVECVAPLDMELPMVPGSALLNAFASRPKKQRTIVEGADRRYTMGPQCHRPSRLPGFTDMVANANDTVTPSMALQMRGIALPTPASDNVDQEMQDTNGYLQDNSPSEELEAAPLELSPPSNMRSNSSSALVGTVQLYVLALRGTTTNTGLLACSDVVLTCGVAMTQSSRAVLCM